MARMKSKRNTGNRRSTLPVLRKLYAGYNNMKITPFTQWIIRLIAPPVPSYKKQVVSHNANHVRSDEHQKVLDAGANRVISKPIDPELLRDTLLEWL